MPLLDLKTDLKSLKYGQDTPGGGDSGQPYIKTDINTVDSGFNKLRFTKFDDGLIRGGAVGAIGASVVDTLRIGKFLTDPPKGPLFIVKQVGLQLTNPRVESTTQPTDRPISGQGALTNIGNFITNTVGKIENAVGPTRIYNLGINTLAQVPVNALGGHIVRHGFLPNNDDSKYYYNVVTKKNFDNNTNRLLDLTNKLNAGTLDNIDNYIGGASSVYGIGNTLIRKAEVRKEGDKLLFITNTNAGQPLVNGQRQAFSYIDFDTFNGAVSSGLGQRNKFSDWNKTRYIGGIEYKNRGLTDIFYDIITDPNEIVKAIDQVAAFDDGKIRPQIGDNINDISKDANTAPVAYPGTQGFTGLTPLDLPNKTKSYSAAQSYTDIANINAKLTSPNNLGIYAKLLNGQLNKERLPGSKYDPTYKNYYGVNGEKIVIAGFGGWKGVTREVRVGSGRYDQINLTPIFEDKAGSIKDKKTDIEGLKTNTNPNIKTINDLVKFRIQAINTDDPTKANWMIFRAYITDLSDNVDATWNEVKYAGRGDKFYVYDGFTRKMSVTFKVAALSRQEMEPMYQKLNYLMSNLMPDYSGVLMRGPLMRMTIGNWIDGQLCKLDSLSYKPSTDSPWEIGLNDEELILPHVIEVSLGFTPIGSQTRDKNELPRKEECVSNIAQNWNGISEREYITPCEKDPPPPKTPPDPNPKPDPKPDPKPQDNGGGGGGTTFKYDLAPIKLNNPSDITGKGGQDERFQQKEQKLKNPDLFKNKKNIFNFAGFEGGSFGGGGASGGYGPND